MSKVDEPETSAERPGRIFWDSPGTAGKTRGFLYHVQLPFVTTFQTILYIIIYIYHISSHISIYF